MNRLASALIVGGAALLLMWQVTPATSAPPPPRTDVSLELDQAAPVLAQVNAQVDKLRERLAAPPSFPPPSRDPFNFGTRPDRVPRPAPADAPTIVDALAPPAPVPPAVFSVDDDVQIVAAGQSIGSFIVRNISADRVVLVHRASNAVFSIKLN
jgi:hypothetical protein